MKPQESKEQSESAFFTMSAQFGESYVQLLSELSDESLGTAQRKENLSRVLKAFPERLQPFIKDALGKVITVLKENEKTLKDVISGNKDISTVKEFHRQLLAYIIAGGGDQRLHSEVYSKLDGINCLRHAEGIYSVTLNRETLAFLKEKGLHSGANGQFLAVNTNMGVYRFVLFQENDKDEEYLKSTKLHELHHFLYMVLGESMGIRGSTEQNEIVNKGFVEFRDEMVAYLINYIVRGSFDFGGLHAKDMAPINGDNYSVSKNIYDLLNIVESSCRIAKQHGASAEVFLYPVITSRSFSEMKMRLQKVVDVLLARTVTEDESTEEQKATPLQKIRRIFGGRR